MRRTPRASRQNPIARDAASELVAYTKKEGGFLRVEYTNAAGEKVTSLLRPEGVYLLAHNFRDERGQNMHEDAKARRKVDLTAATKIEVVGETGDLKLSFMDAEGKTREVVVTLDDFYITGNDFRDVSDQPMGLEPKARRSINLTKIDSMAYRAEKDVDPIVTGLGGAFAFLNWRYRIPGGVKLKAGSFANFYDALQAIAFEPETPAFLRGRGGSDKMVITPSWEAETGGPSADAVAVVDALLTRKFSDPQMRRWLVTTGNRPFMLDGVPENAPVELQVDQNPILERLRAEAREAQVQPTTPLPSRPTPELEKRITETSIMGDEGLEQAEAALDSLRASTLQRSYWAFLHRDPSTPELVPVAVEDFRRDSRPDVDAVIYIQSIRDSSNTPDKVFALLDPPLPYIVVKQPANLLDESGVNRALRWMAEHPDWQRIGIAMVTTDISRKQITPETLLYSDMLQAGLTDPQLRETASSQVEIKYSNDGHVKSPITGEVLGVRPIATGYEVAISVAAPLQRGIGMLVHVTTAALNAVMTELDDIERYLKALSDPDNTLSKTAAFAAVGAAWKQVRYKVERLRSLLLPRQEVAKRRRAIIGGKTAPIAALKQELLDLKDAKDAVMGCLDVLSDHVRLVRRLVELGKLEHSGVTVAEQRAAGTPQMRRWLVASESVPSISAESADPLAVRDMKARLAKINRMIEQIPAELRSDSKTDNLRGLAKIYPGSTAGAKYEFVGDELRLYEYLRFPAGRQPLNLKPGQLLLAGDTIILSGKRTDIGPVRVDTFAATACYVITQPRGIDCAPVTVTPFNFGRRITDRDELSDELTDRFGEHVMLLRLDALRALDSESTDLIKKISEKLVANNEYDYIKDCPGEKGAKFVVDPVFYCILFDEYTGDVWMPPMGSIVPGHPGSDLYNEFVDGVSESPKFGPSLVGEALTKTVPFMSDIPLDVNKPKLLWRPKGDYASAIRSILVNHIELAQQPYYFQYEKNYFPTGKGARAAKKAGEEMSSRLVTMGTYRALGTAGAVLGAEGKMFASKTVDPRAPAASSLTYGRMAAEIAPQKYAVSADDSIDTGGLTIVGARGGKGEGVQQLRMAAASSRFDRYMEKLIETQKVKDPTARQRAMASRDAQKAEEREAAELKEEMRLEKEQRDEEIRVENEAREAARAERKRKKEMKTKNDRTNPDPEEPPRRRRKLADLLSEAEVETSAEAPSAGTPAAPKAAAVARTANIFASSPGSSEPGKELSETARMVEERNVHVQSRWTEFNDALRGKKRENAETLQGLLNAYLAELRQLEETLSARDAAMLKQMGGAENLRKTLRHESTEWSAAVRAPYSGGGRAEKGTVSAAARIAFAKTLAGTVDAFGRPLAPPSDEEMRSHGLAPLDLSVTAVKPGYFARDLKRPLDYTMLVKAAGIAAAALKEKPSGISASAVSCRVMKESGSIKNVAYTLASDPEGGQYHQLLFRVRKSDGSRANQKFKTVLLWFSPGGDHIIFYVNGFPTCEFHLQVTAKHPEGDHVGLLGSVMQYTEDWFTDGREHEKRKSYRVLLGKSGTPRLYQIWGPTAAGGGIQKDVGTFSARAAIGRIFDYSIVDDNGVLSAPEKVKAGVVKNWITPEVASKYGTTPAAVLEGEAGAYIRAIAQRYGMTVPRSFNLLQGSASALRKGLEPQVISEVTAAMARGPHLYTLYYPPLYSEEGVMDRTANENTAVELRAQLDMLAKNAVSGSEFTIIDASLFRVGPLKSSIEDFDNYRLNQIFVERETSDGPAYFVVPPYRYLHDMLAKAGKTAKITLVCPLSKSLLEDEGLVGKMTYLTENEGIVFKAASVGGAAASLKKDFEHGSSLVLWNDPDTPEASRFFGLSGGLSEVARIVVDNLGLIRRVVVESTGYHREVKEQVLVRLSEKVEAPMKTSRIITMPEMIREAAITLLAQKIEAGVSTGVPLSSILGLPPELIVAARAAAGSDQPRVLAEAALDTMAEAYGTPADTYFKYGYRYTYAEEAEAAQERRLSGFGDTPVRENRKRTARLVASRFLLR